MMTSLSTKASVEDFMDGEQGCFPEFLSKGSKWLNQPFKPIFSPFHVGLSQLAYKWL